MGRRSNPPMTFLQWYFNIAVELKSWTSYRYHNACGTEKTFIKDFLGNMKILKHFLYSLKPNEIHAKLKQQYLHTDLYEYRRRRQLEVQYFKRYLPR